MNHKATRDDPRYAQAKAMRAEGMSSRSIKKALRVRWATLTEWLRDAPAGEQRELTPAAYATGFRWFNTRWR